VSQRAGPHGVTEGRHGALQVTALHGPAKDVEAVLADEPLRAPGSVADEVHPALDLRQREARKLQPHLREERDDPGLVRQERLVGQAEEDEVIDVPAVVRRTPNFQREAVLLMLGEVVQIHVHQLRESNELLVQLRFIMNSHAVPSLPLGHQDNPKAARPP